MKESPILFNLQMVQAQLDGIKTQTRRLDGLKKINESPDQWEFRTLTLNESKGYIYASFLNNMTGLYTGIKCPFGMPGDSLWVRETWAEAEDFGYSTGQYFYRASYTNGGPFDDVKKWHPSIHMPRKASRTNLFILKIRIERLQNISEEDAFCEGMTAEIMTKDGLSYDKLRDCGNYYKTIFKHLWESINSPNSWIKNPWVWVLEFK